MKRAASIAILLLILGLCTQPYWFTGESTPAIASTTAALPTPTTRPTTEPAVATQPAAQTFGLVRGQSGFWKIGRANDKTWWFIDPNGKTEFLNTVTTVQPYQVSRDKDGPNFVSRDYNGGITPDGDLNVWAAKTVERITAIGFKGVGAWSNPVLQQQNIPFTRDLNIWKWCCGSSNARLYSPGWSAAVENAVKLQCEPLKSNHNLIGYFIDNELDWGDGGSGPGLYFDNLAADDPNRQMVIQVMQSVWTNLDNFNKDWASKIADWKELEMWTTLPHQQTTAYGRLFSAWLSKLSEDYFRITTTTIRKYDPNHLILGVRFKGYAPLEVVRASRNYTNAQSLNYYVNDARLDYEMFSMMHEQSEQPIVISEFSFHALDGRSGNRNTVGFAAQVLDQQARADGYRQFTTRLARVPYVIGAEWFQWMDEPPAGRNSDGEDVNFGIVDVDDRPYQLLADAVRTTTSQLNLLHDNSARDDRADVWRESFANKPVHQAPFLAAAIRLNGELSDWPTTAKVPGIRHSQTVGLERSTLPLPNVYLGWRPDGLYLALEVFDQDIQRAPANGWWWTRDHVEFWVSTKPVPSDQNNYDLNSHQFFFVPIDFPSVDGIAGLCGQWHRDGDALKDNLIPHTDIKDAVRILPDRYVVEIFIPKKALHGFDPETQPAMAFNIHVRNFQHAIDYFWSAPKEVMTQLRPNTWGNVYLTPERQTQTAQTMVMPIAEEQLKQIQLH